ncbi:MAG: putative colanic acid biosynthesis acetyltransferase [Planctomycetota bacterium]
MNDRFYRADYRNRLPVWNHLGRAVWGIAWLLLFRPTPPQLFLWRRLLLRLFGAKMADTSTVYPSSRIWAPWNLTMESHSCLGPEVDCYNVASVHIGVDAVVSLRTFLCTASHDIRQPDRPLITGAITIARGAFVFAEAFIGMNVTVGEGAVVAARAVVVKNVPANAIVAGNPAQVIGDRVIAS